ncbi:hypothetical protein ACFSUS_20485 [Spirosoma soli]|uniref:Uncharacterized protein n=1 Tax=Spirosoma soli TaxID=1770529 RepID=A0ABW5M933_9BACT
MNKLSPAQLNRLVQEIQHCKPHQALHAELLDHIASLIEQRMDQGQDFPTAFEQVMQQANPLALHQLKQLYIREFSGPFATAARFRVRPKRRPATKPFQYMFLSNGLTFLILMGFLIVVSRPLAIPIVIFQTAWVFALAALLGIGMVRWWLKGRPRKPKSFAIA